MLFFLFQGRITLIILRNKTQSISRIAQEVSLPHLRIYLVFFLPSASM